MKLAITGGTGFVGSHLIDVVLDAGHAVAALTRREQAARDGVEWTRGDLFDRAALERLVDGADAVVHVAGVINAPNGEGFERGNAEGTLAMLAAATAGGIKRFVHVSSLAAREPELSIYGASKARAEALVQESGLDWAIIRPPAVYGPGDKETLELFRMARLGLMMMPPRGKLSVIHARDLARLLLALTLSTSPRGMIIEPDDGLPNGWTHGEFLRAIGRALGKSPQVLPVPGPLLMLGARIDKLVRRDRAKLTPDRVAYFLHQDWVVAPERAAPANLWRAQISTEQGLRETADWYRLKGWL